MILERGEIKILLLDPRKTQKMVFRDKKLLKNRVLEKILVKKQKKYPGKRKIWGK